MAAAVEETLAPILSCEPQVIRSQKALLRQWDERPLSAAIEASIEPSGRPSPPGNPSAPWALSFDRMHARAAKKG